MSEIFPVIQTPAFVNKYARKLWKVSNQRSGDAGKDLRKRVFRRFQSFPHACTLKNKDYSVGFFTTEQAPRTVASETSKTTSRPFATVATIGPKKTTVRRYEVPGEPPRKYITVPYDGTFWYKGKRVTHLHFHTKSPLRIVIGETSTSFITNRFTQDKVKSCSRGKPIVIPVGHVYSLGKDGPQEAHATLMIYLPHNKTLYYLDPEGWSGLGQYLYDHSADMRTAFQKLFGRKVEKFYDISLMCPNIPAFQKAERAKGDDLKGLCVLWSAMLMTQYLEYSKTDPKRDPLKMMETLYDPKNATKHPFVQLNRYLQSLYSQSTPRVQSVIPIPCKRGLVWELGACRKPCSKDSERDPSTKRCRKPPKSPVPKKVACPSTHELLNQRCIKKCQPNQVRNPATRRCKKV